MNSNLQKFFQTCKSELQKKIKNSIQLLFQFSSELQKKKKKRKILGHRSSNQDEKTRLVHRVHVRTIFE